MRLCPMDLVINYIHMFVCVCVCECGIDAKNGIDIISYLMQIQKIDEKMYLD